ncbi:uncharacterized protein [Spinacia oleracea]|uniref:Uncharacterized protein n=1 Tax=Spinacia oleracea TaxID=3562 RepID=A0A9R0JAZ9_SPIOL|nr:uncharacterized protein LOC110803512 [Spinacia oleracea]
MIVSCKQVLFLGLFHFSGVLEGSSPYKGNYQLNSTGGTKIYINLDIPEVQHFKKDMVDVPLQAIVRIEVTQPESLEEAMTKNRKTIKELQHLYMEEEEENKDFKDTYTCVAQISFIHDQEYGWMYTSCNNCKSRVDANQYYNKMSSRPRIPNRQVPNHFHN